MRQRVILHIEDDPSLVNLVKLSFQGVGFNGEMLTAPLVEDAFRLLKERERKNLPVDLIISDMQLPDGQGLDLLGYIKGSLAWQKTPVIILSGDCSPDKVSEAYAMGANCYLSKIARKGKVLESFRSIYHFWLETALLPKFTSVGDMQKFLRNAVNLRARTSRFYIGLSKESDTGTEQESFWLERALVEGNLSSLLSFFLAQIDSNEVLDTLGGRLAKMQVEVEMALIRAEQMAEDLSQYGKHDINCAVLGLVEAWDEELLAEFLRACFPMNPSVAESMKARAAMQINELSNHVKASCHDIELVRRAKALHGFSERLAGLFGGAQNLRV